MEDGQDSTNGRFTPGNRLGKGRPPGSKNKPYDDNGVHPFEDQFGQLAPRRRFHGLIAGIVGDLGGRENCSAGELQLVRRCAFISVQCELMEQAAGRGETINLELYGSLTDRLGRGLDRIGLKRRPRDVTPSLKDYLEAVRQPKAASDSEDADRGPTTEN